MFHCTLLTRLKKGTLLKNNFTETRVFSTVPITVEACRILATELEIKLKLETKLRSAKQVSTRIASDHLPSPPIDNIVPKCSMLSGGLGSVQAHSARACSHMEDVTRVCTYSYSVYALRKKYG